MTDGGFRLNEQEQMVEKMVRQWCERTLLPKVPALEAGELEPWPLMREFARTFGLDQMAAASVKKRIARLREGAEGKEDLMEGMGGSPMLGYVVVKELSRVSPGFAMGWGVSVGLAGGAILAKGTPAQKRRWALPILTMEKVAASSCRNLPSGFLQVLIALR